MSGGLDLMGVAEIALRLGLDPWRAQTITRRPGFPAPVARIIAGRIWRAADVEEWIRAHPGDPASRRR